jgi:gamma-glutamyltranspeptidase/glutathione hydrolase
MMMLWGGLAVAGERWGVEQTQQLIRVQQAVLARRYGELDITRDLEAAAARLLGQAGEGLGAVGSPSTVHTSAVDAAGQACSITVSAGYGSGIMPPGTGIWMNNSLGEPELNRRGFHGWDVGERQYSNMAPTVGRGQRGESMAIGSPGADRITTAQMQVLINHLGMGMSLEQAVAHPRLHLEESGDGFRVAFEPGMPVDEMDVPQRNFGESNLFFGGVSAVKHLSDGVFERAADPRRSGVTVVAG